jgi:cyclophilin family peptidyl-prolyl cis-trans isomerase
MPLARVPIRTARQIICLGFTLLFAAPVFATSVILQTAFGDVEIDLFEQEKPETVANFLNYLNAGDYRNSFIHRSVAGFIVQGGGYTFTDGAVAVVPEKPAVVNEPGISNLRGTIAMAKLPGDPNSATSQWFINLADNSANLDDQNGGFTVFGQVTGDGMTAIDAIAALPVWNAGAPFTDLPLIDYPGSGTITDEYLVVTDFEVSNNFIINAGLNDAWYNPDTDGQGFLISVFPEIESLFIAWFTFDTERPDPSADASLGEPGHRWLTAQGTYSGNQAVLDIYVSEGGIFDSGTPAVESSKNGTLTIEFSDCSAGTISYDLPSVGRQGVIPVQRIVPDNLPLCEALAAPPAE